MHQGLQRYNGGWYLSSHVTLYPKARDIDAGYRNTTRFLRTLKTKNFVLIRDQTQIHYAFLHCIFLEVYLFFFFSTVRTMIIYYIVHRGP